jgi:hypothetical protein
MSVVIVFRSNGQSPSIFCIAHSPVTGIRTTQPNARVPYEIKHMLSCLPDDVENRCCAPHETEQKNHRENINVGQQIADQYQFRRNWNPVRVSQDQN